MLEKYALETSTKLAELLLPDFFFEKKYFENQCPNIVIYNVIVQRTFDIFLAMRII